MRTFITAISVILFTLTGFTLQAQEIPKSEASILRVSTTLQGYNLAQPWEKTAPTRRRGLGVIVGKNQVLTTAEMVTNATYIQLQTTDGERSFPAKVSAVDYEANLALISVTDKKDIEFVSALPTLAIAAPAKLKETVEVFQIEDNGLALVTDGVIRGIDVVSSFVDGYYFLTYEIKASMQSASNSFTIPILKNNKLLGLLTSYNSKDQILDCTASEVITAFLKDAREGEYVGFPSLGLAVSRTSDEHFRAWLKLTPQQGGVYITRVKRNTSAERAGIKVGDVLLKLAGEKINRRGYYESKTYGPLHWSHIISSHVMGDTLKVELLRNGKPIQLDVKLDRAAEGLIPTHMLEKAPRYLIKGGLVFQELSVPFLQLYGEDWQTRAPISLLDAMNHPQDYQKNRKRLVFLSRTLRTPATIGYESVQSAIIEKVNGKEIADIPSLIAAFKTPGKNGIHTIELDHTIKKIYLDANLADTVDKQFAQEVPSLFREKE